jgi:hypothetical protein
MRDSGFVGIFGGDCPATGLIFAKPENSSEAARLALPQNAVAIVWRRLAFGISRAIPGHVLAIREPYKATALNGLSLSILSAKIYGPARG